MKHCKCHLCVGSRDIDPITNAVVVGRYISDQEFRDHSRDHTAYFRGASYLKELHANQAPVPSGEAIQGSGHPVHTPRSGSSASHHLPSPDRIQRPSHPSTPRGELWLSRLQVVDDGLQEANLDSYFEGGLVFTEPPTRLSPPMLTPSLQQLVLEETVLANSKLLQHERWLESAGELVEYCDVVSKDDACCHYASVLLARIRHEQDVIKNRKREHWESIRKKMLAIPRQVRVVNTAKYQERPFDHFTPQVLACYLILAFMHLIAGVSLKFSKILLIGLEHVMSIGAEKQFRLPADVETVISHMDLEPHTAAYACCPKCFALYPYDPSISGSLPESCSYKRTLSTTACGTLLLDKRNPVKKARTKPVRVFLHNELNDWVSRLYCRHHIEGLLDRDIESECGDESSDILQSLGLQSFLGPENDPNRPFLKRPGTEGRLVFSLNMDGFNPLMNKEAGKKISVGAIYLVCLSLPPAIRYDIENMFLVSIIPGPHEPSREEINHVIRPLVDDLLPLWDHGVFLTSTAKYPHGRLVRGALVPLVCDLLAARQMSGFAPHSSHHFCNLCTQQLIDIDNFEYTTWTRRTQEDHRRLAEKWRDAESESDREEHYKKTGIRWSELLRLPYWDPTKFVVIDSMHSFFLRLFNRHCRDIWGMNVDIEDSDYPSFKLEKARPSDEAMEQGFKVFRYGKDQQLEGLRVNVLREIARLTDGVPYGGKAKKIAKELAAYRIRRGWFLPDGSRVKLPDETEEQLELEFLPHRKTSTKQPGVRHSRNDPASPEEIENGLKILESGFKSQLKGLRKPILLELCRTKEIAIDPESYVPVVLSALEEWRLRNGIIDASGNLIAKKSKSKPKRTAVLGKETLKEIRDDMSRLQLPSWVAAAPAHPGESKRGKFTADQWRSFCTVNLPITLSRLWGQEPENSRKRMMLDNFMHLVTAVKLATMRTMTPDRISSYVDHMHAYLTGLLKLYPQTRITPYQHLALHFQEFLTRFGPVHAWRCFPFERFNYLLQTINTNSKIGELENTLFRSFTRGQRLRALINPVEGSLPSSVDRLLEEWNAVLGADMRGTRINDAFSFDTSFHPANVSGKNFEGHLSDEWLSLLRSYMRTTGSDERVSRRVYLQSQVRRLGETFQTANASPRDSHIIFKTIQGASAGIINGIFSLDETESNTFFVVQPYQALPAAYYPLDPYRRYPVVAGVLYRDQLLPEILIPSDAVLYHFGYIEVELPQIPFRCIQALPLNR